MTEKESEKEREKESIVSISCVQYPLKYLSSHFTVFMWGHQRGRPGPARRCEWLNQTLTPPSLKRMSLACLTAFSHGWKVHILLVYAM